MLIRLCLVLFVLILSFVVQYYKERNITVYKLFMLLLGLTLIIPFVHRDFFFPYTLKGDYENYLARYQYMTVQNAFSNIKDFGFNLLIVLCKTICSDYKLFFLICISITVVGVLKFIEDNSNDFMLSLNIYVSLFYLLSFNILRQCMACALCLSAFVYIKQHKLIKYLLIVVTASLFHLSALIFLVLYPLLIMKDSFKRKLFLISIIGVVSCFFRANLLSALFLISKKMGTLYWKRYLSNAALSADKINYTIFIISFLLLILLTVVLYIKGFSIDEKMTYIYVLLCCVFSLMGPQNTVFSRMVVYFTPSIIIGVPVVEKIIKKDSNTTIFKFIIGGLLISRFCLN